MVINSVLGGGGGSKVKRYSGYSSDANGTRKQGTYITFPDLTDFPPYWIVVKTAPVLQIWDFGFKTPDVGPFANYNGSGINSGAVPTLTKSASSNVLTFTNQVNNGTQNINSSFYMYAFDDVEIVS